MVLDTKQYNHYYLDTIQLALNFEHRHHISITKLETMSERHATKIGGWQDSKERATKLRTGTGMYTIASFSLVRPVLTLLSRNQNKRCAIKG